MFRWIIRGMTLVGVVAILAAVGVWSAMQFEKPAKGSAMAAADDDPFPRRFALPPDLFDGAAGWLNTAGPMPLPKLRGKIVLLDFWTFCCINCIHILADLEKLEAEFPNELVVVGVHSPKFLGEQDADNIKSAVMRYGIKHPVANDASMAIWRALGVRSWPTLVLVDPTGSAVRMYSGEGKYKQVQEDIKALIAFHGPRKELDGKPLHIATVAAAAPATPLRYPGKLTVDAAGNRLAIADSSHHRLVLAERKTGRLLDAIGSGQPGLKDGDFKTAQFNDPQGVAFHGDQLYVADRKNHALRLVDLKAGTVKTLAGNGTRGFDRDPAATGTALELASPWDVLVVGDTLYIAMAGMHQLWSMRLDQPGVCVPFAGNGAEDLKDGTRARAEFAQPSGLATDGTWLYVADSETSSVRAVGLKEDKVRTLVGQGLFEFGDRDGRGDRARLQHALAVAAHDGLVYVADTYNNRLKTIDANNFAGAWVGDGKAGTSDDPPRFDEPGGLCLFGKLLYVADTNNHLIRVADLSTKKVSTLAIAGLHPPAAAPATEAPPTDGAIAAPAAKLAAAGPWTFTGKALVPAGTKLNPEAPLVWKVWRSDGKAAPELVAQGKLPATSAEFSFAVPSGLAGAAELRIAVRSFPCEEKAEGVCRIENRAWKLPVAFSADGGRAVALPEPPPAK